MPIFFHKTYTFCDITAKFVFLGTAPNPHMHKKILICDDHTLFLSGIVELLRKNQPPYDVTGFSDTESCKAYLKDHPADVFICDLNIDNVDGFTLIDQMKPMLVDTKVIILTAYFEAFLIEKARKMGVHAFLKKETTAEELIDVIEQERDGTFFTNESLRKANSNFDRLDEEAVRKFRLSKQEREIIRLIVEGKTTAEIADLLFISKTTVATHRRNIHRKLEVSNSSSLIRFAHENNLLP